MSKLKLCVQKYNIYVKYLSSILNNPYERKHLKNIHLFKVKNESATVTSNRTDNEKSILESNKK